MRMAALRRLAAPSPTVGTALVVLGLGVCWAGAVVSGQALQVTRHYFYVPVVFAAIRFRVRGALLAGVAATLLAGPLVPLPADQAALNNLDVWGTRGAFFLGIGTFIGLIMNAIHTFEAHEITLLERRASLESKHREFLQVVSHELRTPLTSIVGIANTYRDHQVLDTGQRRNLDASLLRSARRLQAMVESTLTAGGVFETPVQHPIDVDVIITEVIDGLDGMGHRVAVDLHGGDGRIVTSRPHLRMIVHGLLDNALKFSPDDRPVHMVGARDRGTYVLTITDQGPGIPPEFRDRMFEPFTQADGSVTREHGGLGLGLYVASKATEALGGTLTLDDDAEGTVARVTLPQQRAGDREGDTRD